MKKLECQKIVHERGTYYRPTKYPILFKRLESTRTTHTNLAAAKSDIGSDK